MMITKAKLILLALTGAGMAVNGLFMLIDPMMWFDTTPGVARTGLPNLHFIRDIGLVYFAVGAGLIWAVRDVHNRLALCVAASVWLMGHALFHTWEVLAGVCTLSQYLVDVPGVLLPGLLSVLLCFAVKDDAKEAQDNVRMVA